MLPLIKLSICNLSVWQREISDFNKRRTDNAFLLKTKPLGGSLTNRIRLSTLVKAVFNEIIGCGSYSLSLFSLSSLSSSTFCTVAIISSVKRSIGNCSSIQIYSVLHNTQSLSQFWLFAILFTYITLLSKCQVFTRFLLIKMCSLLRLRFCNIMRKSCVGIISN